MILLVGASVRALTESAASSKIQVTGIDFFGDLDCCGEILTPNKQRSAFSTLGLLKIAQGLKCQGLVYGSGPENHWEALRYWEDQNLLLGNGYNTLVKARNPYLLRETLGQIGVKMPDFFSPNQIPPAGSWLLKPLFRGGGHGIARLPSEEAGIRSVLSQLDDAERYIVQEFQDGIPASMTFLADGKKVLLLGFSYQLIQEDSEKNSFLYTGNIVPMPSPYPSFGEDMAVLASHLTADFGLKGINTLDFILCENGVRVLEINPRWSGSVELIEAWLGRSLFLDHIKACGGELPQAAEWEGLLSACSSRFFGKKILYANTSFTIRNYEEGWQSLYEYGLRDIPRPGGLTMKGEPICTVLADGSSKEECMSALEKKAHWAREFYEQMKKDE